MGLRKFLGVTVCLFLALVVESFSLRSPPSHTLLPGISGIALSLSRPNLLVLRGGELTEQEEDLIALEAPKIQEKSRSGIMSAMDATGLTTALVACGQIYSNSLSTWPILTKSVTAAVLFAISDQMAQSLEIRRARKKGGDKVTTPISNKKRSFFSGLVGLAYFGPASHFWYAWVFQAFPGKSIISILQKAVLGQFFFAPPLFCVFFASALIQNGQFTMGNWLQKIRQDLVKGWIGGLGFWPIVNYISYGYIPQRFIPLFVNIMGLIFNIYVSLIANLKQGGAADGGSMKTA